MNLCIIIMSHKKIIRNRFRSLGTYLNNHGILRYTIYEILTFEASSPQEMNCALKYDEQNIRLY